MSQSGIYRIKNIYNNKFYIGSSKNLHFRKLDHFSALRRNAHSNSKLQNSWNKYGEPNFVFEVLVKTPVEYLLKVEKWFIDTQKPHYNLAMISDTLTLIHSEETRNKFREIARNRIISQDRINNGIRSRNASDKWKTSIKRGTLKRSFPVIIYKQGEFIGRFSSATEAGKVLGLRGTSLIRCAVKGNIYKGEYLVRYLTKHNNIKIDKRFVSCSLFDLLGNLVKKFDTYGDIALYLGISRTTVERAISKKDGLLMKSYKIIVDRRRYAK